tara:strand:+ start:24241 stop:24420 length:180 start_codon:yes stop_codon:yes gene_type:complete
MVFVCMVNIKFTNKMAGVLPCLPVFGLGIAMKILLSGGKCGEERLEWKRSGNPTRRGSP